MKILHTLASPWWTGPAELVAALAEEQRALGHEVSVAIDRKRSEVRSEELAAARFEKLGLLDSRELELSVKSTFVQMLRDVRMLRRQPLEVVHAHFSHDHWVAFLGRAPGALVVRSVHAPRSRRWVMAGCDALTAPTAGGLEGSRAVGMVLPALVSKEFSPAADRAVLRARLGVDGEPLIGMVSTFQPSRRHALALEAFALLFRRNSRARLVLVGDGELESVLRAQARSMGLEGSVTFAGYRPGDEFVDWLRCFDQVWVLGLGNDHSARAAAQARAVGARVVAVDEGALSSYADVLVRADPQEIVEASAGDARREVVLEKPSEIARRVLELYERSRARRSSSALVRVPGERS